MFLSVLYFQLTLCSFFAYNCLCTSSACNIHRFKVKLIHIYNDAYVHKKSSNTVHVILSDNRDVGHQ